MIPRRNGRESELNAILIAPNRDMAELFLATVPKVRGFQILGDLRSYPTLQTLEIRLRQLQPQVALIDLASNFEEAGMIIRHLSSLRPPVHVVGLHTLNDSEVILRSVRLGACEFFYAPFDVAVQQEAVARLQKLHQSDSSNEPDNAKLVVFSSAKPGSGASTLATQTAFALKRATGKRVLLADFDLTGGTVGFFLKLSQRHSLIDVMNDAQIDVARWSGYTVSCGGVDILTAPETPFVNAVDPSRLQDVIQYIRFLYDWVVIDTPAIFHKISLLAISEAERSFLVSTGELPSLHLTRKAIGLLQQLGFGKDRFQVVVNRVNKKDGIGGSELGKLFDCPVYASFPNDYFSLHRVITLGRPLANDCDLGRAIEGLAQKIAGAAAEKAKLGSVVNSKPPAMQATQA